MSPQLTTAEVEEIGRAARRFNVEIKPVGEETEPDQKGLHLHNPTEAELFEAIETALNDGHETIWVHIKGGGL
jgi:hypothetical protein